MSDPAPLVTVFADGDPSRVIVAKLLLDGNDIPYVAVGDGLQDLFGMGRIGAGTNFVTGPVQLRVAAEDVEDALEVLRELREDLGT